MIEDILWAGLVIVGAIGGTIWHHLKAEQRLREWAEACGYEWIESEYRSIWNRGPYSGIFSGKEACFRVTVKEASGTVRSGWVSFGAPFQGLASDEVRVTWDEV